MDMRGLRAALESLDTGFGPFAKDVEKKADVMRASVEKVEKALYGLTVRGAERPPGKFARIEFILVFYAVLLDPADALQVGCLICPQSKSKAEIYG